MKEDVGLIMLLFSIIHFHNQQSQKRFAILCVEFSQVGRTIFQHLVLCWNLLMVGLTHKFW